MADKQKFDLGLLEEDDEFEEFPAEGKLKTLLKFKIQSSSLLECIFIN